MHAKVINAMPSRIVFIPSRALHNARDNHAIVDRLLRCLRADNNSHRLSSRGGNETRRFVWVDAYCVTKFTRAPLASWASTCCDSRPASPHCLGSWRSDCKRPPPSTIFRSFNVLNAEFHPLYAQSTCASLSAFVNWAANRLFNAQISSVRR